MCTPDADVRFARRTTATATFRSRQSATFEGVSFECLRFETSVADRQASSLAEDGAGDGTGSFTLLVPGEVTIRRPLCPGERYRLAELLVYHADPSGSAQAVDRDGAGATPTEEADATLRPDITTRCLARAVADLRLAGPFGVADGQTVVAPAGDDSDA
jgi:hypothetical protein